MTIEYLYANARFTTASGKSLAKQSPALAIRDISTGIPERYTEGTYSIAVYPGTEVTVSLYAAGGGGGAGVTETIDGLDISDINGTNGGGVRLTYGAGTVFAGGGDGGGGNAWHMSTEEALSALGGRWNTSGLNGAFTVLEAVNGGDGHLGGDAVGNYVGVGFVNEFGDSNNGGKGGSSVVEGGYYAYGANGGAGSYIKAVVANTTNVVKYMTITVGATGKGAPYGGPGTDGGIATAVVKT